MTRRVRVLRLRRRPLLPWALTVTAFALAWMLDLWLLVVVCGAGTLVLLRLRHWHRRTFLPAVVASTALVRSPTATPAVAIEEWSAIWLAVASGGRPHWLGQAARLVAQTEADPWAAHVAITRLEAAEEALKEGRVLGLRPPQIRIPTGWRVAGWGTLAVFLLALAHAEGTWWLLPTAAALAGATFGLTELMESQSAPRLLASEATTGSFRWDPGPTSPLQLALLAGGDSYVVRRARRLVEAASWDITDRDAALRQLRAAEAMTGDVRSRCFVAAADRLPWWEPP